MSLKKNVQCTTVQSLINPFHVLQVEAILDRIHGNDPAIKHVTDKLQQLGYASWAHRVINTAGLYYCL